MADPRPQSSATDSTHSEKDSVLAGAPSFGLAGQTALITGAGGGIGAAIAGGLAACGADVACLDASTQLLGGLVERIQLSGRRALAIAADVSRREPLLEAVVRTEAGLGPLSLAVNCAGVHSTAPAEAMTPATWQRLLDVNLTGVFLSCQAQGAAMLRHGGGSIVNIGSVSGTIANRGLKQAHYNAAKAAVAQLSRSLALEWADRGIRVNTVSPGYVMTPMARGAETTRTFAQYVDDIPLGRMAQAAEIVGPTVFLLSRAASYVTGAELLVDGGLVSW